MKIIRKIEVESVDDFKDYMEWQALYMNHETGELLPNTEIWSANELILKINSLGCKGEELLPNVPVIGFFGDSTTFGVNSDSWVSHVNIPGFQTLNAGVEGYSMDRVLERYRRLSEKVNFLCVVVYVGWHNIIYNKVHEDYWRAVLDQFAGDHVLAFCTLATCLIDECKQRGLDSLICTDNKGRYFNFWGNMEPTRLNIKKVFYGVYRYNDFIKRYCSERGHILIDLYSLLLPSCYEDIPVDFFDVCHPRREAYPKIGGYVSNVLKGPLQQFIELKEGKSHSQVFEGIKSVDRDSRDSLKEDFEDLKNNVYPLW